MTSKRQWNHAAETRLGKILQAVNRVEDAAIAARSA
jgi:hypothetical protein